MAFYNKINNSNNILSSFSTDPLYDFSIYAKGYRKAADHLVKKFLSSRSHGDYEGYPIVFLYRHVLELHLKNIIYQGARLRKLKKIVDQPEKLYPIHKLTKLSEKANHTINILFLDEDLKKFMERVKQIAKEFDEIDPVSYSYRYPINNKGEYSTENHQIVNIESISKNLYEIFNGLKAIDFGFNINIDNEKSKRDELYDLLSNIDKN